MLKRIQIPSGISRESTQFASTGQWYDANNMRFRGDFAETIGGWSRDSTYTLQGIGRCSFSSTDYSGNKYQFVGTDWKYYVIVGTGATDITPVRATGSLTNPFTTVAGSALLSVEDSAHGLAVNDWVVFTSVGTALTGETAMTQAKLQQSHGFQVASVTDDDNYKLYIVDWDTGGAITASHNNSSGGGTVAYYYNVTSGTSAVVSGQGWGVGLYGGAGMPTSYALTSPYVTVSSGSTTYTITKTGVAGSPVTLVGTDSVYITGLSGSIGSLSLASLNDNWWEVDAVSTNSFTITGPVDPGASGSGGGGGEFYRQNASGVVDGATRGWGDASALSVETGQMRRVYIDNYGEDVMFCNSGGPIYYWDTSAEAPSGSPLGGSAGAARVLSDFSGSSNTPTIVDSFLISKRDGHCVALGCNDVGGSTQNSLLVRWSDQNNPFDWTPTPTNTSGGQVLRTGSSVIAGVSTQDEVIIFTDAAVYSMRFIGPPDVFSFNLITEGVEIIGKNAAVNAANSVFFMGNDGFYVYSGSVSPLPSPVAKYVYDDFNTDQKDKCFTAVNSAFSEVMWFYPTADSFEPNRYVLFNYEDRVWNIGFFDMSELSESSGGSTSYARTSWRDAIVFPNPMSSYISNYDPNYDGERPVLEETAVMIHESGTKAQSSALDAYVESGEVDISDGERFSLYTRFIPDLKIFNGGDATSDPVVNLKLYGRDFPGTESSQISSSDITVARGAGNTYPTYTPAGNDTAIRGRGRSVSMKWSGSSDGWRWRIGDMRLDLQPDGRR